MPTPQYGDYQMEIYGDGLRGKLPRFPVDYASLERAAVEEQPDGRVHQGETPTRKNHKQLMSAVSRIRLHP
jgi:hypothetical protein